MSDGLQLNGPQTLYRRWEGSQWSPFTIDLATGQAQWGELAEGQRALVYYALASLMVAEERITTKFSGLVGAHGSEEEATFREHPEQGDVVRHAPCAAALRRGLAEPAGRRHGLHGARRLRGRPSTVRTRRPIIGVPLESVF